MKSFKGIVTSLRQNRKGFAIGDVWFSAKWGIDDNLKGAEVEFEYEENGIWKNVDQDSFKITEKAEPYQKKSYGGGKKSGGYDSEGQRRGNALTNGTSIVCALIQAGKVDSGKDAAVKAVQIANFLLKEFDPQGKSETKKEESSSDDSPF